MFARPFTCLSDDDADGDVESDTIAAQYGKSWSQWLAAVCAAFFLISTEELARATIPHPVVAAAAGDSRAARVHNKTKAAAALARAANHSHRKPQCAGCGAVLSMREIRLDGPADATAEERPVPGVAYYEFVVRMPDGSNRVITHSTPEAWRVGERVTIIDGVTLIASR